MWFRQVVAVLLLIAATVLLGRYVADRWPAQEGRFLTAEEFFGEELLGQIEELGIPVATHTGLMPEMGNGFSGRRPEDIGPYITYDMCTLPQELTLHFQYREYIDGPNPSWDRRDSFVELAAVHALDEPCSNELVLSMVQHTPPEEYEPVGYGRTIEMEIEDFPRDRSWQSTYYLTLSLTDQGELFRAIVREEWQVITPWGRLIAQLEQDPDPSDGERELGYFNFPLQLGVAY